MPGRTGGGRLPHAGAAAIHGPPPRHRDDPASVPVLHQPGPSEQSLPQP